MNRIVLDSIPQAGPVDPAAVVSFAEYTVIEWHEPREWTSDWDIVERTPDEHPEYVAAEVRRAGLLSSYVHRYTPIVRETLKERRWHVREWSDEETGQRMCERIPEFRSYRI